MSVEVLFKKDNSYIAIKNDKLYILSVKYKDFSPRAITIIPGFQIELGRSIKDIEEALKHTRLPIILKTLTEINNIKQIQIIRMHTGKVDDKVVAVISCKNDIINTVAFNKELIKDSSYRRYNNLSVLHQISIPYNLCESQAKFRRDQVINILSNIISNVSYSEIEVVEKGKQLITYITEEDKKIKYTFVSNKNNNDRFELMSISLA